ncbi:MAG: hypothetical protein GX565_00285 [Lentisphaerae bacterium]|nr:hypothetical protein [Lentisphaerota bacterium]
MCVVCLLAVGGKADNIYWTGAGGSGVGDFNVPSNWQQDRVPGEDDTAYFNNYSGINQNWAVTLNTDVTNAKVVLRAPAPDYETLFVMDQHVYNVTTNVYVWDASGGRITFTNGTLRSSKFQFTPNSGSQVTNLVITMKDVISEAGDLEVAAATAATFEGGRLRVTNSVEVTASAQNVTTGRLDLARDVQCDVDGYLKIDARSTSFAMLNVSGGSNTFGKSETSQTLLVATGGKGALWGGGGTNSVSGDLAIGRDSGGSGEMTVTGGLWTIGRYVYNGLYGSGALNISGGELRVVGKVLALGRYAGATGTVEVSGGVLDLNGGNLWLGGDAGCVARLTLSGDGVLKVKSVYEYNAAAASEVLFDGGTLKAAAAGELVKALDDVRLTAKGLVVDTDGKDVSVTPELKNAAGEAGGITKKGAGTLTLTGTRSATGPVSVLGGTLVMSSAATVEAGVSRIDGTLTLPSDTRLTVAAGSALAGTGSVARVTLADNAALARDKADGAVAPLNVGDCAAGGTLTVALSGYSLSDLLVPLPLLKVPSATFVKPGAVNVTLDGVPVAAVKVKYAESGGNTVLSVRYTDGTMIRVR